MDVTITAFLDYLVQQSLRRKRAIVKDVMNRGPYEPSHDFWKLLREGIAKHPTDKDRLKAILARLTDDKKVDNYKECIKGYSGFLGRKTFDTFQPPHGRWQHETLRVRVNPELGLMIKGVPHVIKLYFRRAPALRKTTVELGLVLMSETLGKKVGAGVRFGVLDMQRGELIAPARIDTTLLPFLESEADAFVRVGEALKHAQAGKVAAL